MAAIARSHRAEKVTSVIIEKSSTRAPEKVPE
jgi:hypothetical protein